jgi:hypothetical protein
MEMLADRVREMFGPYVGREIVVRSVIPGNPTVSGELLRFTEHGVVIVGHGHIAYHEIDLVPRTYGFVS